ncbi:MAG TPA: hypothetical protein VK421_05980 [Pyrinomonadaceae bacterium]|nr:hypothetical protein [Pyrinomonadaceae bacterium]
MTKEEIARRAEVLASDVMGDYAEMLPRFEEAMRDAVSQAYEAAARAVDGLRDTMHAEAGGVLDAAVLKVLTLKDQLD